MQIKYPTAFYRSVIPAKPQQAGNVTFTISSTEPPRPKNASIKIPNGLAPQIPRKPISRSNFGELVFTISDANRTILSNSTKQYILGDVLEFQAAGTNAAISEAPTTLLEIRHDLTRIDYKSLGLSDDDINILSAESSNVQEEIRTALAIKQKQYDDIITSISNLQTVLNETQKALSATGIIFEQTQSTSIKDIIDKLKAKSLETSSQIEVLVTQSATVSADVNILIDRARNVGVIVI